MKSGLDTRDAAEMKQNILDNILNSERKNPYTPRVQKNLSKNLPSEFAVKVYSKEKMKSKIRRQIIRNEYQVLAKIDHAKIIKFYEKAETKTQIHLIMEYFKGQGLDCFLKRFLQKRIPCKLAKPILKQVLHAIQYLHERSIYHRGTVIYPRRYS